MRSVVQKAKEWVGGHLRTMSWSIGGVAVAAALYVLVLEDWNFASAWSSSIVGWTVFAVLVGVAGHFVYAFTRNLPSPRDSECLSTRLRTIFVYAYLVQGVAISASLLLLVGVVDWVPKGAMGGLVYGCLKSEKGFGSELIRCGTDTEDQQWLLHVGSHVRKSPIDAQEQHRLLNAVEAACGAKAKDQVPALNRAFKQFDRSVDTKFVVSVAELCTMSDQEGKRSRIEIALREGGVLGPGKRELSRGLVVPLYVVILSVIGAAVGMTRRLPEIQKQAAHSVQSSGKGISAIKARERVVFQIMQVLAAPLIAVTSFGAFEPDTATAAVLVGFTSGFASEAVLMKLRQASEALTRKRSDGSE